MIQKAIRRCDIPHAAYAANELSGKYRKYLWKRLLTVSAEDCYGIMTKEIVALQQADECVNKSEGRNERSFHCKSSHSSLYGEKEQRCRLRGLQLHVGR